MVNLSDDNILKDIFSDSNSVRNIVGYFSVVLLLLAYHGFVFFVIELENIQAKDDNPEFLISFEETLFTFNESRTVLDDQKEIIEFTPPSELFSNHDGFGILEITITYTETSGEIADPCDAVYANVPPTGANADWHNEGNLLSGNSDDCSPINLFVMVYHDYDGENYTATGGSEDSWKEAWSDSSFGEGIFTLEVEVDVNQPLTSPIPTIQDDGEEVNVTWTAHFFDVIVEES